MRGLRLTGRVLALLGVVLAVLAVRSVAASRSLLERGDALRARGDVDGAILASRRAARWSVPANPYVPDALDRLGAIAAEAEAEGDTERTAAAWRSLRGAILATRSFYTPHRARLARAEEALARGAESPGAESTGAVSGARAQSLADPNRPHLLWTLVLLAGWITWTGGAFAFAQRALDEEDRVLPGPARLWGSLVLVGFGLFAIGMALA